jgi:hypothetical protein
VSGERSRALVGSVFGLVAMVAWTLAVKYLAPWCWFLAERAAGRTPAAVPVMWDFWPLLHAGLAVALWRRWSYAWRFALAVALGEVAVVTVKFALFLRAPEWSFWQLLWFTNKIYVLAFFLWLGAWLLGAGRAALAPARREV